LRGKSECNDANEYDHQNIKCNTGSKQFQMKPGAKCIVITTVNNPVIKLTAAKPSVLPASTKRIHTNKARPGKSAQSS
jgi:hypothetical protein